MLKLYRRAKTNSLHQHSDDCGLSAEESARGLYSACPRTVPKQEISANASQEGLMRHAL